MADPFDDVTKRGFLSDPEERLQYANSDFQNILLELSFTSPASYYKLRRTVNQVIREDIKSMYKKIFFLLTKGAINDTYSNGGNCIVPLQPDGRASEALVDAYKDPKAQEILKPTKSKGVGLGMVSYFSSFVPGVSQDVADQIALSFCTTVNSAFESEVLAKILPSNVFDQVLKRSSQKLAVENL